MNKQLRRLGAGLLGCYLALLAMVNYVQVFRAESLNDDPRNTRKIVRDFDRSRGQILTADGQVLARTVPAPEGDNFEFQRQYPGGDAGDPTLFGHITGYFNFNFGATGVESSYNDELAGETVDQQYLTLRDLFVDRDPIGDVTLTLRTDVQQVARDALGDRNGSVVALDPRDGSILALWSFPTFDPNPLASHDLGAAAAIKAALEADPNKPLRGKTWQERYFPGSTFKIVTGSIGLDTGLVTPSKPAYPSTGSYDVDFTSTADIGNFGGAVCGGALFTILRISCNTAFAEMGADTLGPGFMVEGAERFGFNDEPPIDLPAAVPSQFPTEFPQDQGNGPIARAAIGQGDVQATPLQMALAAGGIGNGGLIMAPHVMKEIRNDKGEVTRRHETEIWQTAMSPDAADTMREAMIGVVEQGTGRNARIAGFEVGGKTGTAQIDPSDPNIGVFAWFVAFAGPPGDRPSVAVAVLVENQQGLSEATGGTVAAPIAQQVMAKILEVQAGG